MKGAKSRTVGANRNWPTRVVVMQKEADWRGPSLGSRNCSADANEAKAHGRLRPIRSRNGAKGSFA